MTEIVILPHHEMCPEGAVVEAEVGESICEALLRNDIDIEHACEMSCACTTCHVIVREGFESQARPMSSKRIISIKLGAGARVPIILSGGSVTPIL